MKTQIILSIIGVLAVLSIPSSYVLKNKVSQDRKVIFEASYGRQNIEYTKNSFGVFYDVFQASGCERKKRSCSWISKKIWGVDIKNFVALNLHYSKDLHNVYFCDGWYYSQGSFGFGKSGNILCRKIPQADPKTFEIKCNKLKKLHQPHINKSYNCEENELQESYVASDKNYIYFKDTDYSESGSFYRKHLSKAGDKIKGEKLFPIFQ